MRGISFSALTRLCSRSDEEAMLLVKNHDDHHEFDRLVKRWQEPIYRLCARMIGDTHRAEDLKQETFLRLFQKRKTYQPASRFSTYLWRIALNLCYDELRRRERRKEFLHHTTDGENPSGPEELPAETPGPDMRTATLEEGELVRLALLKLPEIYRAVVVLRHYEDMKLARIAEVLGIPEGTVNSRMAEALSRLSRILEPRMKAAPTTFSEPNPMQMPRESFVL